MQLQSWFKSSKVDKINARWSRQKKNQFLSEENIRCIMTLYEMQLILSYLFWGFEMPTENLDNSPSLTFF